MRSKRSSSILIPLLITLLVVGLLAIFTSPFALAQGAAAPAPNGGFFQEHILPWLLNLAGAAATYVLGVLAVWLHGLVASQKNETVKKVLELVATTATTAVANIAQTVIRDLKAAHEDGRLTEAEARAALAKAVDQVWAAIGQAARDALLKAAGGSQEAVIKTYIVPAVEAEVALLDEVLPAAEPITDPVTKERVLNMARARLGLT